MTDTITSVVFAAVTDWSQPMLTFYDDATGERTELSAATLGNWAAKTANFLVDEIGLTVGDEVIVDLPEHWQTAAILLGAWWAGASVRVPGTPGSDDPAPVAVVSIDRLDAHTAPEEVVVASLDPFALGIRDLPPGVLDFASAVRVHGDQFIGSAAAELALNGTTVHDVISAARTAAHAAGVDASSRVLTTREWHTPPGIVANLLGPLVVGASLVAVHNANTDLINGRVATEKATASWT